MTDATARLSSWARSVVVDTVLAYRRSMGEQPESSVAYRAARDAFIGAGGDAELAPHEVPRIIGAASQEHSDWFWRPANERIAQEERRKARDVWPLPINRREGPA